MASSNTITNKCATCSQNSDEHKVKPGITLCEGCRQTYCLSHFVDHRQALNKKLDDIAGQRDILRAGMEDLPTRMSGLQGLKMIDDWKNTMLQTVTEAANNAQQQVHESVISEMEREFNELTNKITSFRDNDNCFETDIEELQTKIEKLSEELNNLPGLHRIHLNLPTLDSSNMIHIKSFETHSLPEIAKDNDSITLEPKEEYRSFLEDFLTTYKPSIDLSPKIFGCICASPTMLIDVPVRVHECYNRYKEVVNRLVFHRDGESRLMFDWEKGIVLDIQWSHWLQQFIVLTKRTIVTVDALDKQSKMTVDALETQSTVDVELNRMNHWKNLCLIVDNTNRVFCYNMPKNSRYSWLLLYCWSVPTTCTVNEKITAIGLNEHHIVLSIQCGDQHHFSVRNRDMTYCSDIQLAHPCTTIQALLRDEWLLYDSSKQFYYVIDSKLEQHDEPYLSSLKDFELTISCEETDKILLVLLARKGTAKGSEKEEKRIIVYTSNCLL